MYADGDGARVLGGITIRIHIRSLYSRQNLNPVAGVTQVLWAALLYPLRFPPLSETHRDDADDTVEVQVLDWDRVVTTPRQFPHPTDFRPALDFASPLRRHCQTVASP